ncbi:UNVERIFIED_CONTAM: hypothetical protein HDU68_002950 [Siphonaria sp. JEL0065]|nr:hypothetical protein HDU68_002950 [Siphonaria sp. JEL0065]
MTRVSHDIAILLLSLASTALGAASNTGWRVMRITVSVITIDSNAGSISYTNNNPVKYNAFCAGHSQAADGGVHVVGGDRQMSTTTHDASKDDPFEAVADNATFLWNGIDRIRKFTPSTGVWDESVQMTTARWYPTVVTLGDGTLFIAGGDIKNIDFGNLEGTINPTYEFFPSKYQPAITSALLNWAFPHNLYPISLQLPSGKIFMMVSNRTVLIDPTVDPGTTEANTVEIASTPVMDHAPWIYPHTPTFFLLPMKESTGYIATVVICGGSKNSSSYASADCLSITPESPGAAWTPLPNMPHARLMPEATLLPDGTVLLTNGMGWGQAGGNAGQANYASAPVFPSDLYDPVTNKWSTVGTSTVVRSYHNGAILLADGSVITTGNEMANFLDFWGTYTAVGPSRDFAALNSSAKTDCYPTVEKECTNPYEYRIEQFTPAYLFNGPRPIISTYASTPKFTYGSIVAVPLDSKGPGVTRITLVRYTTTTHSVNTDQRLLEPTLLYVNTTAAIFKIPSNPNLAVPGNWHLFALSAAGVPSVAQMVLIGTGPVTNATIPSGGATKTGGSTGTRGVFPHAGDA